MKQTIKFLLAAMLFIMAVGVIFAADIKTVNVLCYHRFEPKNARDAFAITPETLKKQMQYLKDNGYNVITMKTFLDYIDGKGEIPDRAVLLTIDDGYKNIYTKAFPILQEFGYKPVLYIYQVFSGKSALSPNEVREMMKAGFDIGCHSNTHTLMPGKKRDEFENDSDYIKWLKSEIVEPKSYLEKLYGVKVETYAYPYGAYSMPILDIIKKAGYKAAFSVVASWDAKDTNRFAFKRTMILQGMSMKQFVEILEKKPIIIENTYPEDGAIIEETKPVLKAKIVDDSELNTATIKFKAAGDILEGSVYDSKTKELTYAYDKPLKKGVYARYMTALGKDGKSKYEYAWLFIVGKPVNPDLFEAETKDIAEEVGNGSNGK